MAWNIAEGSGIRSLIHGEWTNIAKVSLNDLQHEMLEYGACHVDVIVATHAERGPAMTADPDVTLRIGDSIEFSGSTHSWTPAALPQETRHLDLYARCAVNETAFVTASVTLTFLSDCVVNEYDGGKLISFLALEIQRLDHELATAKGRLDVLESQGG